MQFSTKVAMRHLTILLILPLGGASSRKALQYTQDMQQQQFQQQPMQQPMQGQPMQMQVFQQPGMQPMQPGMEGMQQPGMQPMQQPGMVGMQQPGMEGMQQPGMEGMQQPGMEGMQQPGMVGMQQPGMGIDGMQQAGIGLPEAKPALLSDSMPVGEQSLGFKEVTLYDVHVQPALDAMDKHLMPQIEKQAKNLDVVKQQTNAMISQAHGKMTAQLAKMTGHLEVPEWLRLTAFLLLLFPFAVWVLLLAYFFTQIASVGLVFTLAKCGNLFWTIYCLFLSIMTFVISEEPLFFFHQNHPSEYIAFQFVKAGLFAIHLLVLLFQCVNDMSFLNLVQWIGATMIGVHYYFNAWHLAMMEQAPVLGFKYYAFYMYCFFIFFILPQSSVRKVNYD